MWRPRTENDLPPVALIPWGDWIEDFLDAIGSDINGFCEEIGGGWLFGYVEALRSAGFRPYLVAVSREVRLPEKRIHKPSGTPIWFLPSPPAYRVLRRTLADPYATSHSAATRGLSGPKKLAGFATRHIAPYAAWPARRFADVLSHEGCAAILTQEYEYARFDILVAQARRRGIPLFASFQGGTWQTSRIENVLRRASLHRARGIIVASKAEASRVHATYGLPVERIHHIYNPLDVDGWVMPERRLAREQLDIPPHATVAAWHGRITYHPKGLDVLLDAWADLRMHRADEDDRLMLIGTGVDAGRLREDIARMGLDSIYWRDEYITDKAEIRRVLAAADVFVFPSRHEGFPVALVEGLASGLPAVAADAPGVREILGIDDEAEVGRLVPTGDASALAGALRALFENAASRARLGGRARNRMQANFTPEAIGRQLREVLLGRV